MANVPYAGGVPDAQPDARPPDDYQRIEATPASFGGGIAQGAENLGQGAVAAGKFWGEIQTDDASNNYQKQASELAEHVSSLQGADALSAQSSVKQQLDDLYNKYKTQLGTPEQQLRFDNTNRPYTDRYILGQLNKHFIQQGQEFGLKTAQDGVSNAASMAATAGSSGDIPNIEIARRKAMEFEKKGLTLRGQESDPEALKAAQQRADTTAYRSAAQSWMLKDPEAAQAFINRPNVQKALGPAYDPLAKEATEAVARSYVSKAEQIEVTDPGKARAFVEANQAKFGDRYGAMLKQVSQSHINAQGQALYNQSPSAPVGQLPPNDPGTQPGYDYKRTAYMHESSGNAGIVNSQGNGGLFQFSPGTWRGIMERQPELQLSPDGYHDASPAGVAQQNRAYDVFTSENRAQLQRAGIEPTDKNAFMAAFLGAGGATSFIKAAQANPNAIAAELFPKEAAANRPVFYAGGAAGGSPRTLAQVYALMTKNFSGRATVSAPTTSMGPGLGADFTRGAPPLGAPDASSPPSETPSATPAAFEPDPNKPVDANLAPPPSPQIDPEALATMAAQKTYHDKLASIEASDAPDEVKVAAGGVAKRVYEMAMAEAGLQTQQREARERAVTDDVLGVAAKNGPKEAYARLDQYVQSHQVDYRYYNAMSAKIAEDSGDPNPKWFGKGYKAALDRLLLPGKDPDHIGTVRQLVELQNQGLISGKGFAELNKTMTALQKSEDEVGLQTVRAEGLKALERILSGGVDPMGKIKNAKGLEIFQTQGVAQYNRAFNEWRSAVKEGKGDEFFALSDPKKLNAFAESLYSRSQRDLDALRADAALPEEPNTPPPAAPPSIPNPAGWDAAMKGWQGNHAQLALNLENLASDPQRMAPLWDQSRFGLVHPASEMLNMLGIPYQPPPIGRPGGPQSNTGLSERAAASYQGQEKHEAAAAEAMKNFPIKIYGFHPENALPSAFWSDATAVRNLVRQLFENANTPEKRAAFSRAFEEEDAAQNAQRNQ